MSSLFAFSFTWPALPFTVLLCAAAAYWVLVLLGGLDMDFLDFDLATDIDGEPHGSFLDFGMLGLRWLNLGDVPLMVWISMLALSSWLITTTFDRELVEPGVGEIAMVVARNLLLGALAAKMLTQPLRGRLHHKEPNTIEELLGRQCVVTTSQLTGEFGQIECTDPDGAPLRLNARTEEDPIPAGTTVEIVDYAPESRLYFVKRLN